MRGRGPQPHLGGGDIMDTGLVAIPKSDNF